MASANTRRVGDGAGGAFQPYLDSLRQELQQRDPTLLSVAVAVLAVLLTLVFWKFIWSRKSSQRAVLFVGLCDSGKTLLFVRLLTGQYRDTQTSITDSSAIYKVNNNRGNSLTLIDLPGHESLRLQFLDRFKSSARAVCSRGSTEGLGDSALLPRVCLSYLVSSCCVTPARMLWNSTS
ncbi:signal recognition particle receptor, B subunit, isoform CRA_a [Rattus norvegicus]|uniref:Signal recognition particle receptor subunit beta n=1 Tax=Rattus norvegicus TaxID=10116 RepID=A6I2I5_RAT|nr:signal recognition particle receptor, B subunit, isoform CRA_a [Rattus norvegicus]